MATQPSAETTPHEKRPRSQNRQRRMGLRVACTPEEYERITRKAQAAGMSTSSFLRAAGLGKKTPRSKPRAPVDLVMLGKATVEINRVGNNLNQIARALNRMELVPPAPLLQVLKEHAEALKLVLRAFGREAA